MKRNNKNLILKVNFKAEIVFFLVSLSIFVFALTLSALLAPMISEGVRSGILFCFSVIIPSIFPFMILADLLVFFMHFEKIKFLRGLFSRLFKINGYAISVFLIGLISGFPIGAKLSRELYISGKISKNECERLIGISNNASPAFVISGVGYGLFGSLKLGLLLYFISIISSAFAGLITARFAKNEFEIEYNAISSFSFTESVKSATRACINICGFICFFSVIIHFINQSLKNELLVAFLSSFLEIGNAAKFISSVSLPELIKLPLLSFAIGFSGLSVHFQSKSILSDTDISMNKYYLMKLLSATLSAAIMLLIVLLSI